MNKRSDIDIFNASMEAGYVGGGYYNPFKEFFNVARPIVSERIMEISNNSKMTLSNAEDYTYLVANIYAELQILLLPGELIFAVYDNGRHKMAVYIHGEERLMDFEAQVNSGDFCRCGFFAVDEQHANKGLTREFNPGP